MITYDEYKSQMTRNHGRALAICNLLSQAESQIEIDNLKSAAGEVFAEHEQIKVADVQF